MTLEDEFDGKKLSDVLLEPTRIYVKEFKANKANINALAHITGEELQKTYQEYYLTILKQ